MAHFIIFMFVLDVHISNNHVLEKRFIDCGVETEMIISMWHQRKFRCLGVIGQNTIMFTLITFKLFKLYSTFAAFRQFLFQYVFGYGAGDVFSCVADIGWITGHSYVVYGPLSNGATSVLFESIPTYPDPGRYWETVQRLKINQLYAAPTALRLLLKYGDDWVKKYDRSSLKVLGTGMRHLTGIICLHDIYVYFMYTFRYYLNV